MEAAVAEIGGKADHGLSGAASAQAQRTSAIVAIEQMAKLASSAASPDRMRTSVAAILEQWLAEGLDEDVMRDRLEQLQADLDGDVENVENAEADAETDGQRRAAAGQRAALMAARDGITQALEKLNS